ncbi:hypothetical protein JCM6882_005032 [Rhodosporidiobolus microsporus]
MLDRLPVELLSHILRLAAPLEYTPDKYRERRELLRQCCLVCKRVRDVAQPMLPEVFAIRKEPDDVHLRQGEPARGQLVRVLALNESSALPCPIAAALRACKNVVDLRVLLVGDLDLGCLADLKNLRHLVISSTGLTCPTDFVLPNLLSLALATSDDLQTASDLEDLLTSKRLPSLRSLAIDLTSEWSEYGFRRLPQLPLSLLQQLDDLVVDANDTPLADLPTLEPAPVLVECCWAQFEDLRLDPSPLPSALRLYDLEYLAIDAGLAYDISTTFRVLEMLRNLPENLSSTPPSERPRVLVLPTVLHPTRQKLYHLVEQLIVAILQACVRCGVEVLWETPPDWHSESRFSLAFREWVLENRRKKAEAARAQAA